MSYRFNIVIFSFMNRFYSICIYLSLFISLCDSYKILVYNPAFGHSHTSFLGRIADTLVEAGHDVTELAFLLDSAEYRRTNPKSNMVIVQDNDELRAINAVLHSETGLWSNLWTMDPTPQAVAEMSRNLTKMAKYACGYMHNRSEIWGKLKEETFDVAIIEAFDACGYGILHQLNVKATISASSTIIMDHQAYLLGQPVAPSYVPGAMIESDEKMTFFQRAGNAIGSVVGRSLFLAMMDGHTDTFRELIGPEFPDIRELISEKTALFLTNSVPCLDFPHPTLHKIVDIGGIGVPAAKPLAEEWSKLLNKKPKTILISFGTMAKSIRMPKHLKEAIIETARRMSDVQFIWKYEGDDLTNLPENLYLSKWTPQPDLLADPRLSMFVTHGGLASTTEIAHSGCPALVIPLFGDQPRNAAMLIRQGTATKLGKFDFPDPDKLITAIKKVLDDPSYKINATRLANLLRNVPFTPKELLIRNVEFVAQFGHITTIDPYGRKLGFIKYFLLDVIGAVLLVTVVLLLFIIYLVRKALRRCCGGNQNKEKKE